MTVTGLTKPSVCLRVVTMIALQFFHQGTVSGVKEVKF